MISLVLTDRTNKEFEQALNQEMDKAIKHFEKELITIRTGRAHPALVENLEVLGYGSALMKLKEVAAIAAPDPRLITIQPWDAHLLPAIEKAILSSDLGINPLNDGNMLTLRLPEMSAARRTELQKILGKKTEEAKISLRNVRKEFHNLIRTAEKDKQISEDNARRLNDVLQKITDKFTDSVNALSHKKEQELKIV